MKAMGLFSLFCLLLVPSVTGQSEDVITQTEVVRALPGTDVTLECIFPKLHTTHIIQTQWSKTDGSPPTKIAVYHPIFGTHYFQFPEASYNFSVSFSTRNDTESACANNLKATSECDLWALHLKNVTMSLGGQYECTFATYPYGTKAARIQLIVKAEEERHYLKKVWLNQTLEIPCLANTTSENLSTYPLKWLVGENGRKEELVTKDPSYPAVYGNSSALFRQRIHLGLNYTLKIFPTKITDDGRVFSCHVLYHPERVQKSSTTVRVFAHPEISVSLQEGSPGTLEKPNVSCVVRKAFPKPNLLWYMDGMSLTEQPGEISVVQEDFQDSEGFYQLRSTLMLKGTHETHKTFSCACLFPFLGNETWNISSEEIFVSFANKSNEASSEAFTTTVAEDFDYSTLTSTVMTASEHQSTSVASLDFTSQANLAPASTTQAGALTSTTETKSYTSTTAFSESLTTAHLNDSTTESPQSLRNATYSSENTTLTHQECCASSGNAVPLSSKPSYSITDQTISVTRGKDFFTTSSLLNSTGDGRSRKANRFPWPAVVAVLLLFCSSLLALGIRKWCQYQKEIMNRPPSFKPPPPPIKYTSMVESDGTPPSCHELESL